MAAFNLRLLGGFALEKWSGAVDRSLSQPRAEAVLAVLAVCGTLGCTRERLIGLLWPEKDQASARHGLRDALYAIRGCVGRGAIPSGGELLYLDGTVVSCDVQRFLHALEESRLEDAVAAYGGLLLDGFHLHEAHPLERWLDGERSRLFRERQGAIKDLARTAETAGRWDAAATWWAHGIAADPYDTRLVARRMVTLARSGDRANAIQEGEAHRALLQAELEIVPDGAFLEQLERIRNGEVGPEILTRAAIDRATRW